MSIEEDDLEAAILFPRLALNMVELARKCHYPLAQYARLEAERVRHQERANKEAVINCELNAEIDRIQDEWKKDILEIELLRTIITDIKRHIESCDEGLGLFIKERIAGFENCLPNTPVQPIDSAQQAIEGQAK